MIPTKTKPVTHTWHGLRDTQSRRLVLEVLVNAKKAVSVQDLHTRILREGDTINLVTVYRILERFEEENIVHKHPTTGKFSLCTIPEHLGHHGFLTCTSCGKINEFHEPALCKMENAIAKRAGFRPVHHVSEIMGTCRTCS